MSIQIKLTKLKNTLPSEVTLVAVSKTKSNESIIEAYNSGQRIFGENKVQEMTVKWEALPKDIEWHMIGHLQSNKVKYIVPYVSLIHGVDRLKILKEINKEGEKQNRIVPCLLQVHIASETTKFGFNPNELEIIIEDIKKEKFPFIKVEGLMGMASFTEDISLIKKEFSTLKNLFDKMKNTLPNCSILSMGMSNDYPLAIEEGSTMIRVGSKIFGERNY